MCSTANAHTCGLWSVVASTRRCCTTASWGSPTCQKGPEATGPPRTHVRLDGDNILPRQIDHRAGDQARFVYVAQGAVPLDAEKQPRYRGILQFAAGAGYRAGNARHDLAAAE